MKRRSLGILLAGLTISCGSTGTTAARSAATSSPSGLEEVTILARGME